MCIHVSPVSVCAYVQLVKHRRIIITVDPGINYGTQNGNGMDNRYRQEVNHRYTNTHSDERTSWILLSLHHPVCMSSLHRTNTIYVYWQHISLSLCLSAINCVFCLPRNKHHAASFRLSIDSSFGRNPCVACIAAAYQSRALLSYIVLSCRLTLMIDPNTYIGTMADDNILMYCCGWGGWS